eukprot:Gb_03646 [translate_table: standard]
MVAGGGSSVIYVDTVGDLSYESEHGNYEEYNGALNEDEVLQYARVLIDYATKNPDGHKRALVIGGGIANFIDVATTFSGIIQALRKMNQTQSIKNANICEKRRSKTRMVLQRCMLLEKRLESPSRYDNSIEVFNS